MHYEFVLLPIVGALIGWTTNYLAVKMLFRPIKPIKLPFVPISIQGLLPRRKLELAESIARAVEEELLPREYFLSKLNEMEVEEEILSIIKSELEEKLEKKIPNIIPFRESLKEMIIKYIEEDLNENFDDILYQLQDQVIARANIGDMIKDKITSFPIIKIEELVLRISAKELEHIEVFGGVLGFLIGIGQATLLYFIK